MGVGAGGPVPVEGEAASDLGLGVRGPLRPAGGGVRPADGPAGRRVTPEITGTTLVELVQTDPTTIAPTYMLTGAGLQKLP